MNTIREEVARACLHHFTLISKGIDVTPLLSQLEEHPELWDAQKRRKMTAGSPHSRMSDIWVRYNDIVPYERAGDFTGFTDKHIPIWYPAYYALPALHQIIFDLMAKVQGEMLGGVLITRIPPGEGIAPHVDSGWHVEYFDKYYLSLKSSPGARFCCDHDGRVEKLEPKPGEIFLFDNRKKHWVENESAEDRITLIVCIRTQRGS